MTLVPPPFYPTPCLPQARFHGSFGMPCVPFPPFFYSHVVFRVSIPVCRPVCRHPPVLCFGSRFTFEAKSAPLSHVDSRLTPVPRRFPFDPCPALCFRSWMPPVPRCVSGPGCPLSRVVFQVSIHV
ncbi:hypothetical protein TNCV_4452081 [Trichonephila clavipes]|nr:hypothetical protein TNCV_4452081 [Trichonephila clavipes]